MTSALKQAIMAYTNTHGGDDGFYGTAIRGLVVCRSERPTTPQYSRYQPCLCITVQGAKQVSTEEHTFMYGEMQYLVVNVDLPLIGGVTHATTAEPFLGLILNLDVSLLREVLEQSGNVPTKGLNRTSSVFVGTFQPSMADCVVRILRLLDTPQAIPVLYPSITRELYYWLLASPDGAAIAQLALPNSHTQRIAEVVRVIREEFAQPLRVERLAAIANMSSSSFHHHFKAVTSMTPLQYQKRLRLLEARHLLLADVATVSRAASEVGYESPAQFSREYSRLFGVSPQRDMSARRATPA